MVRSASARRSSDIGWVLKDECPLTGLLEGQGQVLGLGAARASLGWAGHLAASTVGCPLAALPPTCLREGLPSLTLFRHFHFFVSSGIWAAEASTVLVSSRRSPQCGVMRLEPWPLPSPFHQPLLPSSAGWRRFRAEERDQDGVLCAQCHLSEAGVAPRLAAACGQQPGASELDVSSHGGCGRAAGPGTGVTGPTWAGGGARPHSGHWMLTAFLSGPR